ncbi:MAG TPA: hypothetical protein DDW52_17050 [Planctomycetaceae bacterium]|nr:hypothetical protein [Planctomycetaceae bacterium]
MTARQNTKRALLRTLDRISLTLTEIEEEGSRRHEVVCSHLVNQIKATNANADFQEQTASALQVLAAEQFEIRSGQIDVENQLAVLSEGILLLMARIDATTTTAPTTTPAPAKGPLSWLRLATRNVRRGHRALLELLSERFTKCRR